MADASLVLADAMAALAGTTDGVFARLLERNDFDVSLYKPGGVDTQTPHLRDELYVVARGTGVFVLEAARQPFEPGDAFFVAAGKAHRFEDFTPDFATWVIFFGTRP